MQWLTNINNVEHFRVENIPLADLRRWHFEKWSGDLCHESGGFFAIRGLKVKTNVGPVNEWTQPIIDQPETGVLGIITKKIDGIVYFLMQAKPEPGNINTFQISPTVQATRSNFNRIHGGKPTRYLEYFTIDNKAKALIDQLQSEQGARFLSKRNRNIIVRIRDDEDIDLSPNHCWLTLAQLKSLMLSNNTVNMDARSVLSNVSFAPETKTSLMPVDYSALRNCLESSAIVKKPISDAKFSAIVSNFENNSAYMSEDELLRQICKKKFNVDLKVQPICLNEVSNWVRTPNEIKHEAGKYFSVVGVRVNAANREVESWDQPIVMQHDPGIVGSITKNINDTLHFLVQLKMESGNHDLLEVAPTVQCITGSYENSSAIPYLDEMLNPLKCEVVFDTLQSEEGGRFYKEENRNVLFVASENLSIDTPERYLWMTIYQMKQFLKYNNLINVELRSLLAIL